MAKIGDILLTAVVLGAAYLYLKSIGKLPSFLTATTTESTAQEDSSCASCSTTAQSVVADHIFVPGIIERPNNGIMMNSIPAELPYLPTGTKTALPDAIGLTTTPVYVWPSAAKATTVKDAVVTDLKIGDPWLKPDRSGIMGVYKGMSSNGTPIWGLV